MLLKSMWIRFGQSWDEKISNDDKQVFLDWVIKIQTKENTSLSWNYFSDNPEKVQLHIFSDASLEAMSIVAFFRAEVNDGVEVSFVLRKCRLAPINQLSIERLGFKQRSTLWDWKPWLFKNMTYTLTVLLIGLIQLLCFNGYIQLTKTICFSS